MATTNNVEFEIYHFHVWIRQISPMIWRRLLVRSDSSVVDSTTRCKLPLAGAMTN
jgi:hypothetical protein